MSHICRHCGNCKNFEQSVSRGELHCKECGLVLEERQIVNDVQFRETETDGSQLVGQFVGLEAFHGRRNFQGPQDPKYTQRELFILKAKESMVEVGEQLEIPSNVISAAGNLFAMCVNHDLASEVSENQLICICLYVLCRQSSIENHSLEDFAQIVHVNIDELERTYEQVVHVLNIDLPPRV